MPNFNNIPHSVQESLIKKHVHVWTFTRKTKLFLPHIYWIFFFLIMSRVISRSLETLCTIMVLQIHTALNLSSRECSDRFISATHRLLTTPTWCCTTERSCFMSHRVVYAIIKELRVRSKLIPVRTIGFCQKKFPDVRQPQLIFRKLKRFITVWGYLKTYAAHGHIRNSKYLRDIW